MIGRKKRFTPLFAGTCSDTAGSAIVSSWRTTTPSPAVTTSITAGPAARASEVGRAFCSMFQAEISLVTAGNTEVWLLGAANVVAHLGLEVRHSTVLAVRAELFLDDAGYDGCLLHPAYYTSCS